MPFDPLEPGTSVQLQADPSRRGVSTGRTKKAGTRTYVQVEFGPRELKYIDVSDLRAVDISTDDIGELLVARQFGKIGDLSRLLTYRKISSRLSNVFYAMQASRTDFYAYQFKPVYKFIESDNGRILIADEVGLGKTIEAGLIWLESKARSNAQRLLVICPSMLREKWKRELRFRFNVDANILDSGQFRSLLEDFEREGDNFQCAAICSIQGLRSKKVRDALAEFDSTGYQFDLIVVDEAHHLRNVETQSHRLGRQLSDLTDSLVLLTATPIHLRSEDLFRLLSLLDSGEFSDREVFERRLQANQPILETLSYLRRIPADVAAARRRFEDAEHSEWLEGNPVTGLVRKRLDDLDPENTPDLIEASRLLDNLNLLGTFVSRTRKREVSEWRVIREASVIQVDFSPVEMDFYAAVTKAVRDRLVATGTESIGAFAVIMPQRQMASCIPAMVAHYREKFGLEFDADFVDRDLFTEDLDIEVDDDVVRTADPDLATSISTLATRWDLQLPDSKYDALILALRGLFEREPETKVIVFSYFRRTLSYLSDRLQRDGIQSVVIHGGVAMDDRQSYVDRFRLDQRVQVLLSSEVGAEGIDLQFCRVVVNYDLPWNPMKVEQRIGRVDRLGQKSDKISIMNLSVTDTIEERMLDRLYERIGIFERSLGDLEPILGAQFQSLLIELLRQDLSPEDQEKRITQTQRALEEKRRAEIELEDKSAAFVGTSDFILERIRDARSLGRWITPSDVRSFVTDFFMQFYRGTRLSWDQPSAGLVSISLSANARHELGQFIRNLPGTGTTELLRSSDERGVLAFDTDAAQESPGIEFLSHFHPLLRWIVHHYKTAENPFHGVTAVEVHSNAVSPGDYLFAIESWEFNARSKEEHIAYAVVPIGDATGAPDVHAAELLIQDMLRRGRTWDHAAEILEGAALADALGRCSEELANAREVAFGEFQTRSVADSQRRRSHLQSLYRRKRESLLKAIDTMERHETAERKIKGFRTRLTNLDEAQVAQLRDLDSSVAPTESFDEVGCGVCRVHAL